METLPRMTDQEIEEVIRNIKYTDALLQDIFFRNDGLSLLKELLELRAENRRLRSLLERSEASDDDGTTGG
jgi:hypothetical protein